MVVVKIEKSYDELLVSLGVKASAHQLEWRGAGIECYLVGSFNKTEYAQACNLFNNICIDSHIPLYSVRRVKPTSKPKARETDTKRMF